MYSYTRQQQIGAVVLCIHAVSVAAGFAATGTTSRGAPMSHHGKPMPMDAPSFRAGWSAGVLQVQGGGWLWRFNSSAARKSPKRRR